MDISFICMESIHERVCFIDNFELENPLTLVNNMTEIGSLTLIRRFPGKINFWCRISEYDLENKEDNKLLQET